MGGNLTIVCRNIEVPTVRHEIVSRSGQGRERLRGVEGGGGGGGVLKTRTSPDQRGGGRVERVLKTRAGLMVTTGWQKVRAKILISSSRESSVTVAPSL